MANVAKVAQDIKDTAKKWQDDFNLSSTQALLAALLTKMDIKEDEALEASRMRNSIYEAILFVKNTTFVDCNLCYKSVPQDSFFDMAYCEHRFCRPCAQTYFTNAAKEQVRTQISCPFCSVQSENSSAYAVFFHQLKSILDEETMDLFEKKIVEGALLEGGEYRHCANEKCGKSFLIDPTLKRPLCCYCNTVICGGCWKVWESQHNGISCEQFEEWKRQNDPDYQSKNLTEFLNQFGIDCPNCNVRYALAKGGCMHFTCASCKFEFCSGCYLEFKRANACGKFNDCASKGLHAHHPRNCYFYLRDESIQDLEALLEGGGVEYKNDATGNQLCNVQEQKEASDGSKYDEACGKGVVSGDMCESHYKEYLVSLINKNSVDPVTIFSENTLIANLRRFHIAIPAKGSADTEAAYRTRLQNAIQTNIPYLKLKH